MTLLLLALTAAVLGRLLPAASGDPPWRWGGELALAAGCGLVIAPLCAVWMAEYHLILGEHFAGDFTEYCAAVVDRAGGTLATYSRNRSVLPAWPSALLLPGLGLIDAMVAASTASVGVMAAGLYLWGRALHSRLAGAAAALSTAAFLPLVLLSRMLTFYPETTAAFTLAAGLTAVALRVRSPLALALASLSVALCLLVDLRGLIFALSNLAVIGVAALWAPWRQWPVRLAIPALALGLGWSVADHAYLPQTASLEEQVDLRRRLQDRDLPIPVGMKRQLPTAYIWGRSDPREIPQTLRNLQAQAALAPPELLSDPITQRHLDQYLRPWSPLLPMAGGVAVMALLASRGRTWRLLALALTAAPFAASLQGAVTVQRAFVRFLATGEPLLALLLGMAVAGLVEGGVRPGRASRSSGLRLIAGIGLLAVVVLGVLPSPLSPVASWRIPLQASDQQVRRLLESAETGERSRMPTCVRQVQDDIAAGLPPQGRLFGGLPEKPQ